MTVLRQRPSGSALLPLRPHTALTNGHLSPSCPHPFRPVGDGHARATHHLNALTHAAAHPGSGHVAVVAARAGTAAPQLPRPLPGTGGRRKLTSSLLRRHSSASYSLKAS